MNRKYLYTHLIVAFVAALVLIIPDFVLLRNRMNNAAPPPLHHRGMNHIEPPAMHRRTAPFAPPAGPFFNRVNNVTMIKNFTFFFCMTFSLLVYNTFRLLGKDKSKAEGLNSKSWILIPENLLLCFLFFMSYALIDDRPSGVGLDGFHILKCVIITVISYLFVRNLLLANHRQQIVIENVKVCQDTLLAFQRNKIIPLPTENIAFCYFAKEKVRAYTYDGQSHSIEKSLNALSEIFDAHQFFRVNRQFIVSRKLIKEIEMSEGGRLLIVPHIDVPETIVISKDRVAIFKNWLQHK